MALAALMLSIFPGNERERLRGREREREREREPAGDPPGTREYDTVTVFDDEHDTHAALDRSADLDNKLYLVEKDLYYGNGDPKELIKEAEQLREQLNDNTRETVERDRKRAVIEEKIQVKDRQLRDAYWKTTSPDAKDDDYYAFDRLKSELLALEAEWRRS